MSGLGCSVGRPSRSGILLIWTSTDTAERVSERSSARFVLSFYSFVVVLFIWNRLVAARNIGDPGIR
jgi:hypothetical protein